MSYFHRYILGGKIWTKSKCAKKNRSWEQKGFVLATPERQPLNSAFQVSTTGKWETATHVADRP